MPISNAYTATLNRRAVVEFIKANERSPTEAELRELKRQAARNYPTVDQVGISGFELDRPQFGVSSSVERENNNREAMIDDMLTLNDRLDNLTALLEDSFRGFYSTSRRANQSLKQIESRVNNLLLLNGSVDVFIQGIEEEFETQEFVDSSATDASVEAGYCTLGRTGYTAFDLANVKLKATTMAENGTLGQNTSASLESLKEQDGTFWEHLVYTDYKQGRVSLVLEAELTAAAFVGEVRFSVSPTSVNKQMTATLFYSLDGSTYTALEPYEVPVTQQELMFNVGLDSVKKVQLVLSKEAADTVTSGRNQNVYVFSLDSFAIYSDLYKSSLKSTLVCGPYEVVDAEGNEVLFSKATLTACVSEPEDTAVDFFLSKDGISYQPISWDGSGLNLVSFSDSSPSQSSGFLNTAAAATSLVESVTGVEEISFQDEAVLNTYVLEAWASKVPIRSMVLKRNVVGADSPTALLQAAPGWYFDPKTSQYSTTVYIDASEGRRIDFGPSGIFVNGTSMSGEVYLAPGYSVLSVSDSNWQGLANDISTVDALNSADALYPYNHRYLIEGYPYPGSFEGEQVYTGVYENFGRLMKYVAPELFTFLDSSDEDYWSSFTIEQVDGNLYFKFKVDKSDSTWSQELISPDWAVQNASDNKLYVKALLSSSSTKCTPVIDSLKVRVV